MKKNEILVTRFHHLAIVVESLIQKTDWYCQVYAAKRLGDVFSDHKQKVNVQFIQSGETLIELLEPLGKDSAVSSFLKKHGSGGIYHLAFEVNDLDLADADVRNRGGIVVSRTKGGWRDMEVMFALFLDGDEKQIVEYIKK
jgi:methylmalonyl-CoA/ethylmalonyl-CoA epimerase|tara:strand:+ start:5023 stop:5445 length:423 start_codon:yes stop_codon:yes gene_type:complete